MFVVVVALFAFDVSAADDIGTFLNRSQFDLATSGRDFLRDRIGAASFVMIGGLHGDNETQALVQTVIPLTTGNQRLVVTEMSPWTAARAFGTLPASTTILRGIDIEETAIAPMIRALAVAHPNRAALQRMATLVKDGYSRDSTDELLSLAQQAADVAEPVSGGVPLIAQVVRTLQVEGARAHTNGDASALRERVMKDFFIAQYRSIASRPTVVAVLGRNHLHRGIDRRGVSTLGNFLAEFAVAEGRTSFNVAVFAAGGTVNYNGVHTLDERGDDPAFELLAKAAKSAASVFDLKAIREPLRQIPPSQRSPAESSLMYWADSYDAIICFREVTPAGLK